MCDPVTIGIVSLGLSGASAVSGYVSQKRDANRVQKESDEAYAANKSAAISAANLSEHELTLRESEEALASASQISDFEREAEANRSTAVVSAAEAGVSGNSLDAVLADIKSQESRNKVRTERNTQMRVDQLERDKEATLVEAKNNIATVRQTNVRQPSLLTPVFQVAQTGLQVADQYLDRRSRAKTSK